MKRKMLATASVFLLLIAGMVFSDEAKRSTGTDATTKPPETKAGASTNSGQFTVIGYLEKRDRVITIKAGRNGTVYSVATKDGKVLFENVSAEQLKAEAPQIHELIKTGVAGDARVQPRKIDMSLR